jgi:predicted transcriptional regulator
MWLWYHRGIIHAVAMTLRLTEEQDQALQALADAQKISKQEAAVRAIEDQAEQLAVARDVDDWLGYALGRYDNLLARLAQ